MLRFKITEEALIDVFSPHSTPPNGRLCVEGLPDPSEITLSGIDMEDGMITFFFNDNSWKVTDAKVTFTSPPQKECA